MRGQLGQTRRQELTKSVREFNKAVNPGLRLGLKTVSGKADEAPFLSEAQAALHIDDRLDPCDQINKMHSKLKAVLVAKPSRQRYRSTHIGYIGFSILGGIPWKQFQAELSG